MMVKLPNMQGMTIAESTHKKLTELKNDDETYDSIVNRLCEMDQKYNFKSKIIEYEFLTYDISKVFRIVFEKNKHHFEYFGKNGFENNISAWNSYPPISNGDKELFIEFKSQKKNIITLQNMGVSMDFGEFMIRKVG